MLINLFNTVPWFRTGDTKSIPSTSLQSNSGGKKLACILSSDVMATAEGRLCNHTIHSAVHMNLCK